MFPWSLWYPSPILLLFCPFSCYGHFASRGIFIPREMGSKGEAHKLDCRSKRAACASFRFNYETQARNQFSVLQTRTRKQTQSSMSLLSFCYFRNILSCLLLWSLCGQHHFRFQGDPLQGWGIPAWLQKGGAVCASFWFYYKTEVIDQIVTLQTRIRKCEVKYSLCYPFPTFLVFCHVFCYGHFASEGIFRRRSCLCELQIQLQDRSEKTICHTTSKN